MIEISRLPDDMFCIYHFGGENSGAAKLDAASQGTAVALPRLTCPDDLAG
jgi:hypothetical protein